MRPGASWWVVEARMDVVYIAKVALGSWSYAYGADFFQSVSPSEVDLLKKAAALFRTVHIMSWQ